MRYWWASQGKNHPVAIEQGSLWTCTWADGSLPTDRALIKRIEPGDVVFHYQGPYMRAVSVATTTFKPWARPEGYPKKLQEDPDEGWLVRVAPVVTELEVPRIRIAEILSHGSPGPLNKNGSPQQKYLSKLTRDEGSALLLEVDIDGIAKDADHSETPTGGTANDVGAERESDAAGQAWLRIEQRGLRRYLLGGHAEADCGLCGRQLPSALLVAGHIKPRALCSNEERWDYESVAMLTCLLGCDALFENGYIVVDPNGVIEEGRTSGNPALTTAAEVLAGSNCSAFTDRRSPAFEAHRRLHRR